MRKTVNMICGHPGCNKIASYMADNKKEFNLLWEERMSGEYRCPYHSDYERNITTENPEGSIVYTAGRGFETNIPVWNTPGQEPQTSIFTPAGRAFIKDAPEGSRLIVSIKLEVPE